MSVVDQQIARLTACFSPPETTDPKVFLGELKIALTNIDSSVLVDGVTEIIQTRKFKVFPSIADIRTACIDRIPHAPKAAGVNMAAVFRDEDARRKEAIEMLRNHPQVKTLVERNMHLTAFDFAVQHGRMPDAMEWRVLKTGLQEVDRLMREAEEPTDETSTWRHITRTCAAAIRARRKDVAKQLGVELVASTPHYEPKEAAE